MSNNQKNNNTQNKPMKTSSTGWITGKIKMAQMVSFKNKKLVQSLI